MGNLLHIIATSIGLSILILFILYLLAIIFAVFVIVSKNPIRSVLNLIALFLSIAVILILIGINFIGISYILVYVGAVSILFLFILMLINIRVSELSSESVNSILLSFIVGFFFLGTVNRIIPSEFINLLNNYKEIIFYVNSNDWEINVFPMSNILSLGNIMYTNLFIWLIITSIILLLAMVGTIVITIKAKDSYKSVNASNNFPLIVLQSKAWGNFHLHLKARITRSNTNRIDSTESDSESESYISDWSENYPEIYEKYMKDKILSVSESTFDFKYNGILQIFPDFDKLFYVPQVKMDLITTFTNTHIFSSTELCIILVNTLIGGVYITYINPDFINPPKSLLDISLNNHYFDAIARNATSTYTRVMFFNDENYIDWNSIDFYPESAMDLRSLLINQGFSSDIPLDLLTNWLNSDAVSNYINARHDIFLDEQWNFIDTTIDAYRSDLVDFNRQMDIYNSLVNRLNATTGENFYLTELDFKVLYLYTDIIYDDVFNTDWVDYTPYGISTDVLRNIVNTTDINNNSHYIMVKFMEAKVTLYDDITEY